MLICAAVISMFLVFGGTLVWGDFQTRAARLTGVARSQQLRGN